MVTAWAGVWFRLPEPPLPLRGRRLGAVARDLLRLGEQLREPIDLSILGSDTNTQGLETQGVDESGDRMRFVGHAPRFVGYGRILRPRVQENRCRCRPLRSYARTRPRRRRRCVSTGSHSTTGRRPSDYKTESTRGRAPLLSCFACWKARAAMRNGAGAVRCTHWRRERATTSRRRWGSQDRTRLAIRRRMAIVRPESSQTDVNTRASRILRSA